ncbi:MAG: hypothetical protein GC160_01355 [Acidobacteria bacterium]|nr:hypothetical protein [Acidobacteriota bacterium]
MDAGLRLKNVREQLGLRYREVQQASELIAQRRKSSDFAIALSRLADIENKGVLPNIHRIYSLCAIYRLDFAQVLDWYGVSLDEMWRDAMHVRPSKTHALGLHEPTRGEVLLPLSLSPGVDLNDTVYLSRFIQEWGRVPLSLLAGIDVANRRFGFVGWEDERMSPMLQPGALVQIDDSVQEIVNTGWANEFERPIYFLEMRDGFACCWCSLAGDHLILQPHPGSPCSPELLRYPQDVDVVGQVVGVAMQLRPVENLKRTGNRRTRPATAPK